MKTMSENQPKHWKEQWEDAATDERERLSTTEVEKLLRDVRAGNYGNYYMIWYAIADNATLEQAGWILYNVLTADIDYLYRYHAAAALIQLLGDTHFQAVDLSGNPINIQTHLPKVREMLVQRIGAPPA
jgi:hypothetical protein